MAGTRARDKGVPFLSEQERAAAAAETGAAISDAMLWPALPNCENIYTKDKSSINHCDF